MQPDIKIAEPKIRDTVSDTSDVDFSELLIACEIPFRMELPYLQIGELNIVQGWILHISTVITQMPELIKTLLPVLSSEDVPFKIPVNNKTGEDILSGLYGYEVVGKVISVYPDTAERALQLAKKLVLLTAGYKGPAVPTDAYLGGTVYTRYGAFKPVLRQESNGTVTRYIYNSNGELIPDIPVIPFQIPDNVGWPFATIAKIKAAGPVWFENHIRITEVLKWDPKGSVFKGVYRKNWFKMNYCLIKEGKKYMCADHFDRDIRERLAWQYKLHSELSACIPVPKILDWFQREGDAYLVMEFIEGISIGEKIRSVYSGRAWMDLLYKERLLLLEYLLKIIDIIERLHKKGFVHRDITSANFLVDINNQIYIIDLELMYSIPQQAPSPPFTFGSMGFMSPEQKAVEIPTEKEDIYSLGALMIVFFTGMSPAALDTGAATALLRNSLRHFIGDDELADIMTGCLQYDRDLRPSIQVIKSQIETAKSKLLRDTPALQSKYTIPVCKVELKDILYKGLNGLVSRKMTDENGLWFSNVQQTNPAAPALMMLKSVGNGMYEGLAGILYVFAEMKAAGYLIDDQANECYYTNMTYLQKMVSDKFEQLRPGLYTGTAGAAFSVVAGIKSTLLKDAAPNTSFIHACLNHEPEGMDMVNGATGQGLAILFCSSFLEDSFVNLKLKNIVDLMLKAQQNDGSWEMPVAGESGAGVKITGIGNGVAGIVLFLLAYIARYDDRNVRESVVRGLEWLIKQARKGRNGYTWYVDLRTKGEDSWQINGINGIALTFIKAYELLQNPMYREIAESTLSRHSLSIISRDLSFGWGLSGLGEVYLEAYRVFRNEEWQVRADWIACSLMHLRHQQGADACFWRTNPANTIITADFMTGNSGVCHFIARYLAPGSLSFPLA